MKERTRDDWKIEIFGRLTIEGSDRHFIKESVQTDIHNSTRIITCIVSDDQAMTSYNRIEVRLTVSEATFEDGLAREMKSVLETWLRGLYGIDHRLPF